MSYQNLFACCGVELVELIRVHQGLGSIYVLNGMGECKGCVRERLDLK